MSTDLATEIAASRGTAPAVAAADRIVARALDAGASDIHIDPEPESWVVRMRIDGVLQETARIARASVPTLVARFKVLAELPTYVTDVPQDGRIAAARVRAPCDLRLAVIPTVHGEKAVLRLFDPSARLLALHELGLPPEAARALEEAVLAPRGVVILTGPAGSGKSTTIHAALLLARERSKGRRSIVGIEDPVERVVPGITQTQVNEVAGYGFPQALKALLRQDPEVIYLGEIRDADTAAVAIQAGLTGHLVITTVHSGSCAQVLMRLLDMGIEPHLLTSALSAVFAQRLVRKLCSCSVHDAGGGAAGAAGDGPPRSGAGGGGAGAAGDGPPRSGGSTIPGARRPVGCPECQGTGYRGRIPVVERLAASNALRKAILARAGESAFAPEAGQSLEDHARALVARGETSKEEIERVLGPLSNPAARACP